MKDKDKLIVVIYVGTDDITNLYPTLQNIRNEVSQFFDESVKLCFIPDYNNVGIKIDCINPVLLDEEEFKKVDEKLSKIDEIVEKKLNNENK